MHARALQKIVFVVVQHQRAARVGHERITGTVTQLRYMTMDTIINVFCTFMSFNTRTTGGRERICRPHSVITRQLLVSDEGHHRRVSNIKYLRLVAQPKGMSLLLLPSLLSCLLNLSLLVIASAMSVFAKMFGNSHVMSALACVCLLPCGSSLLCRAVVLFHCSPRLCPAFFFFCFKTCVLISGCQLYAWQRTTDENSPFGLVLAYLSHMAVNMH